MRGILLPKTHCYQCCSVFHTQLQLSSTNPTPLSVSTHSPNMQPKLHCQPSLTRMLEQRHNAQLTWMHLSSTQHILLPKSACLKPFKSPEKDLVGFQQLTKWHSCKFWMYKCSALPALHRSSKTLQKDQFTQTLQSAQVACFKIPLVPSPKRATGCSQAGFLQKQPRSTRVCKLWHVTHCTAVSGHRGKQQHSSSPMTQEHRMVAVGRDL